MHFILWITFWTVGLSAGLGAIVALMTTVMVERGRLKSLPWIPTALHAVRPEPSALIRFLAAVNDVSMAVREGWNASQARRVSKGGLDRTLNRHELEELCHELRRSASELRIQLAPFEGLHERLQPHAEALAQAWAGVHEMRIEGGEWGGFRPALAQVARSAKLESRHEWTLDSAKAIDALRGLQAVCAPAVLFLDEVRDYRVDYDAIDSDERALIERLWDGRGQSFVNHWLDSTDIDEEIVRLSALAASFRTRCAYLKECLEDYDGSLVVESASLRAEVPQVVSLTGDVVTRARDEYAWTLRGVQRRIREAEKAALGIVVLLETEAGQSDRSVLSHAIRLHATIFPLGADRFLVGRRGIQGLLIGLAAGTVAAVAFSPLILLMAILLSG